jgi:hypothetical protein
MRRMTIAVLLLICAAPTMIGQTPANPLVGVWRATGRESAGGQLLTNIPPAIRMFTTKHYSWIANPIERPMVSFDKATDAQKTDLWNFVAEMGTYEIKGSNVVTLVMVGRDPGRTTSAYSEELTFKVEENRLLVRTVRPNPGVWTTYVRLE